MIQIDIDMPKQCGECPLCVNYDCVIHKRVTDEYYDTLEEQYAHCPLTMPSAQFNGINKGVHEITESDRISYSTICDKFPSPHVYFNTYAEAEHWARFNQPNNRPYYIIERSEHFEIVGEVR